ncbi:antibiotic biosynthesis monooxygenase [Actinomycetospora endophytica]|uniref:Antibiotic biosynthesis monooxygenase n=1 Tax=Actinomycetospora endophytica TaxID=2291215 RepID=A0ABS8PCK7_9PSEU|nr:antibiotic biosynthesis monooxygenase [Actinomycetospora endophytica]MCD2196005.1 antibiotic biosynthesis monooxygenase [Actinomycetospora endophytica]
MSSNSAVGPAPVGPTTDDVVAVVVAHAVPPQDEAAFLEWQQRMTEAERGAPGHVGSELLRPVPGVQEEWVAVTRFAGGPALEAWLASAERRRVLDDGERFRDFRIQRVGPSFGSWFAGPDAGPDAGPPSWKTALSVLVGLYPTVVLLTLALSALWPAAPLWASLLVGNVLSVSVLTWVVMPVVTRALGFWLEPASRGPRTDVLGTVVPLMFLAFAAAVFWVLTT